MSTDGSQSAVQSARPAQAAPHRQTRRLTRAATNRLAAIAVGTGLIALLLYVYGQVVFGNWNYSYTNCLYRWKPFASENVATQGYCYSDITDNVLPIAYTTLHQGLITAWVPTFSIGAPMTVNLYFSPFNYLYLLPFDIAMPLIAVAKVVIAFLGMYFLLRQLGYTSRGGFIAGTTYALSAAMVTWQGWPHTEVGAWAPWLFLVLDKLVRQLRAKYIVWTAILTFLMLMAGMPTFAAYFFYLGFAYALFYACRLYWGRWRRLAATLAAGIGAVAIGAIMSLPYTGELLGSVGSNGYSDSRSNWSYIGLAPEQLKTMFFPFMTTQNTVNNIESMLYTGILAIITVAFTIVRFRSKPRVGFFACSAAIVGILLFTPYLDIVFTNMPMVNTSYKFRIVILLNFALAALLGINMDDLLSRVIDTMRERLSVWAVTAVALAVYVYAAFKTRGTPLVSENNVEFGPLQRRIAYLTVAVFAVVVLCRTCLPALFRRSAAFAVASKAMSVLCTVALCAAVVVDTGYFAMQYLPLTQKGSSAIPQATSTIKYLQENTKNGEKIVGKNVDLPTDSSMFYGLRDIRGHALSMTNPDIKAYYTAIDKSAYESSPTNTVFKNVSNENLLRYLGVKFIVSSETQENDPEYSSGEGMKAVGDDGLLVKELDNPAPEVQLVDNIQVFDTNDEVLDAMGKRYQENTVFFSREYGTPEGAKTTMDAPTENVDTTADVKSVDQQDDGDLTIVVSGESMQYLLVNEYDDGDWTASVDGQETPIYKGNGLIRAVAVPAGNHMVKFTYEPKRLWWYLAATAAGAVVLVAIAVLYKREDEFFAEL
ncbi:hypothetical protein CPA40_08920 [Bifidobacterium callitrichos]|uniref:YfhO family protein n=1 Tax=Bifidobacterium callitrichos TaxID=762209 RepID=A0A2T3G8Y9_9BIFI|nr:YfhO family protein [Bifidobacterium callitrichos]PST45871.1 hypothetical protein CPA40_08920 [Bifidobacterium callitrichos]